MDVNLVQKINKLIDNLNKKQKRIAKNLLLDRDKRFFENPVRNENHIFFECMKTNQSYHFITYVKNKCNCD